MEINEREKPFRGYVDFAPSRNSVSREQIAKAKEVPILDYVLTHEPNNVKRVGNEYRLKDHDSLTMSNGKWHWQSRGIGGATATALNYLIEVRGFTFVEAVKHLAGDEVRYYAVTPQAKPPPEGKSFTLPPRNHNNMRAIAYLQSRGIAKPLILDCIERGSVYESAKFHNCVFVGRDESGTARYASYRGTLGTFRRDEDGSDKQYGFVLPPSNPNSQTVAVFESAVDALSHQTLFPKFSGWRLSLGGTALAALTHFLEVHSEIRQYVICTDNDKAGEHAMAKIEELPDIVVVRDLPPVGKDWNDTLLAAQKAERLQGRERVGGEICL
jgi:hypothetical protein